MKYSIILTNKHENIELIKLDRSSEHKMSVSTRGVGIFYGLPGFW